MGGGKEWERGRETLREKERGRERGGREIERESNSKISRAENKKDMMEKNYFSIMNHSKVTS